MGLGDEATGLAWLGWPSAKLELCLGRSDFANALSAGDAGRRFVDGVRSIDWILVICPDDSTVGIAGCLPAGTLICEPLRVAVCVTPCPVTCMKLP